MKGRGFIIRKTFSSLYDNTWKENKRHKLQARQLAHLLPFLKSVPMSGKDCLLYFLPSFHSWSFSPYVHLCGFPLCVVFSLEAMSPRDIGLQQNLWSMMNEQ